MQAFAERSGTEQQLRFAQLTSSVGAGVLGFGLGALATRWVGGLAVPTLLVGILLHAAGMLGQRQLERQTHRAQPAWATALYWVCWIALVALIITLAWSASAR